MRNCFVACLVAVLGVLAVVQPVQAEQKLVVSIGVETPVGQDPDRPQDNSTAALLDLKLPNVAGPVGLFASGEYKFRRDALFLKEDKFKVGLEAPVGVEGLKVYSYWERRPGINANRYMVGFKYGFTVDY